MLCEMQYIRPALLDHEEFQYVLLALGARHTPDTWCTCAICDNPESNSRSLECGGLWAEWCHSPQSPALRHARRRPLAATLILYRKLKWILLLKMTVSPQQLREKLKKLLSYDTQCCDTQPNTDAVSLFTGQSELKKITVISWVGHVHYNWRRHCTA